MKKWKLLVTTAILSLAMLPSACGLTVSKAVTFDSLFANPEYYNGRDITIEGYFFSGWEIIVLSEKLDYYLSSRKAPWPGGNMMWVEGSIPKDIYDRL